MLGFPWRSEHLVLPGTSRRAALAGLNLYSPRGTRQRLGVRGARSIIRLGLGRVLRLPEVPAAIDVRWWQRWIDEVGRPLTGPAPHLAFLLLEGRTFALVMGYDGAPVGFVKVTAEDRDGHLATIEEPILRTLSADPPRTFRVPRLLADGTLAGERYQLLEPLPEGRQRPPPPDPAAIAAVADELQRRLAGLPRPAGAAPHHVVGHGDFTPGNLRLAADGNLWLFDWEYAGWTPRLADELRYWTAWEARRRRVPIRRAAARILSTLRGRGTDAEILEAARWPEYNLPVEQALRDAVVAHVERGT